MDYRTANLLHEIYGMPREYGSSEEGVRHWLEKHGRPEHEQLTAIVDVVREDLGAESAATARNAIAALRTGLAPT